MNETNSNSASRHAWYINGTGAGSLPKASLRTPDHDYLLKPIMRAEYSGEKKQRIAEHPVFKILSDELREQISKITAGNEAFILEALNLAELLRLESKLPPLIVSHSQSTIAALLATIIVFDIRQEQIPLILVAPPTGKPGIPRLLYRYARESLRRWHEIAMASDNMTSMAHAYLNTALGYLGNIGIETRCSLAGKLNGLSNGLFDQVVTIAEQQLSDTVVIVHRDQDIIFPHQDVLIDPTTSVSRFTATSIVRIVLAGHHANPLGAEMPLKNLSRTHCS